MLCFSEFSSQLPHDGGAFYTTDTMESCRPHYAATWPPVLHAAALWLNATGFKNDNLNDSATDRFHLLFGKFSEVYIFILVIDKSDIFYQVLWG